LPGEGKKPEGRTSRKIHQGKHADRGGGPEIKGKSWVGNQIPVKKEKGQPRTGKMLGEAFIRGEI